jgi:hypothetical protein
MMLNRTIRYGIDPNTAAAPRLTAGPRRCWLRLRDGPGDRQEISPDVDRFALSRRDRDVGLCRFRTRHQFHASRQPRGLEASIHPTLTFCRQSARKFRRLVGVLTSRGTSE